MRADVELLVLALALPPQPDHRKIPLSPDRHVEVEVPSRNSTPSATSALHRAERRSPEVGLDLRVARELPVRSVERDAQRFRRARPPVHGEGTKEQTRQQDPHTTPTSRQEPLSRLAMGTNPVGRARCVPSGRAFGSETTALGVSPVMVPELAETLQIDGTSDEESRDEEPAHGEDRVHEERVADAFGQRSRRVHDGGVEPEADRAAGDLEHVDDRRRRGWRATVERGDRRVVIDE